MNRPAESRGEFDVFPLGGHRSRGNLRERAQGIENPRGAYDRKGARFRQVTPRAKPPLRYKYVSVAEVKILK